MLDCSSTASQFVLAVPVSTAIASESFYSASIVLVHSVLPVSDRLRPCVVVCVGWEVEPSDTLYRQMVAPLMDDRSGLNAGVLAYSQTDPGKTHS